MAIFKGIDVSVHNGNIDWNRVKKYGIDFAIIKCFYHDNNGMGEADNFRKNIMGAVAAGIKYIGVYSYSKADSVVMAKKEAAQTLDIIKPYRKYITMPVYFDVEDRKNKGVEKAVSLAFCEVIEKGGYKAGIYSSGGWYRTYLKDVTEYTRWVAVYNGTFTPPTDIKKLDMWQYSSTGHVDGINGNVDMNYLYNKDNLTINKIQKEKEPTVAKKETVEYYTEAELRQLMVDTFMKFNGDKMGSSGHHKIIDTYNTQKPLPRGYKMTYGDDWCAATCTAIGMMCGLNDIIFGECSCTKLIELYTKAGKWIENEANKSAYKVGNFIIYDWNDGVDYSEYDNKNSPEHIGMIYEVHDTYVMVIEGNMGRPSHVGTRKVYINGRYVRGICAPDYASMAGKVVKNKNVSTPTSIVTNTTTILTVDGSWGKKTTKRTQQYLGTSIDGIVSNQPSDNKKYLSACETSSWEFKNDNYLYGSDRVKRLETFLGSEGYYTEKVDGWCGKGVVTAMQYFLKAKKYYTKSIDGSMGKETVKAWQKYLNAQN